MDMKVMTFNLRVDLPQDGANSWPHRIKKVSSIIKKHQPIVMGTQEGLLYMIEALRKDWPDYHWIGEGRSGGMTDEFCAIFYDHRKLEVVESAQFWLSEKPDVPNSISWESDFPRVCTWGHFRFKKEPYQEFIHYNTHLDHISQSAREHGIHLISEKLNEQHRKKKLPVILTGDFNSEPDDPVVRFLRGEAELFDRSANLQDSFIKLEGTFRKTFHGFQGGKEGGPIDYIFTTRDVEVVKSEIDNSEVNGAYPSDHYPVITTLKF
ncbi:endonuclease/exonuclease/phosphatase family protein [Pseudalkalibacillus sp. A8]|uniref:endonuclease/exonuclease/phosphatase family protein n=1 Tax=Pseudalkalibacillus sp. A8 TaxID=3382641 RepID=UPI0038B5D799